jgi:hypothetical protein
MPLIPFSPENRSVSSTDAGAYHILPSYFRKWTLALMYDSPHYNKTGAIAVTGYNSNGQEQLSAFLNWNLFPLSSQTLLLSGGTRVISSSSYLKNILGNNTIKLTYDNMKRYNVSLQSDLLNNLNAYANGRILSPSYNKW